MNFYDKHIGDYVKQTAHLSLLEHGVYNRLMDVYYTFEEAPAADKVARLVSARTDEELQALQVVLQEFFDLRDDGRWHKNRCDEDILDFQAGEPDREAKRVNEDTRLARHRAERSRLFALLNGAGEHLPWNCKMQDLRAAVDRLGIAENCNAPATRSPETPATGTATPATATHYPDPLPTTHNPVVKKDRALSRTLTRPDGVSQQTWEDWQQLRKAKKAPITPTVLASAEREAKSIGWSLEQFLVEWVSRGSQGLKAEWIRKSLPDQVPRESDYVRRQREVVEALAPRLSSRRPNGPAPHPDFIDMEDTNGTARILG